MAEFRGSVQAFALVAVAVCAAAGVAYAIGDASANLGAAGGRVVGDISKSVAETDRIAMNLAEGGRLDLALASTFPADVQLVDPDGAFVDLGMRPGTSVRGALQPVPRTGRYELRIRSADGSQGDYTLTTKTPWQKSVSVDGSGEQTFAVWMPAGGKLKGAFRGTGADLALTSVTGPDGGELVGPVAGKNGRLKMKTLRTAVEGMYRVTLSSSASYSGSIARKAPKAKAAKLDIANGLTSVSFEDDGVAQLFTDNCLSCHAWAKDYAGVKQFASQAYSRMRSGNMPKGGTRIIGGELALVDQWIRTGFAR